MITIQQTIVVGLGPLGRASVEHFKRQAQQAHGELPSVKLLVLDVSQPAAAAPKGDTPPPGETILSPTEAIDLSLEGVDEAAERVRELYPWLPKRVRDAEPHWTETRAAARLALHIHVKDIYGFLEFHLNELGTVEARERMAQCGFQVTGNEASLIVVGGLGDVAGSALLLDVAYLVRYLCRRVGLQLASTALLFMPPLVPSDPPAEACAYAALKELNACMDRRAYRCAYPSLTIEFDEPPFSRGCYLIDMSNEKSLNLRDQHEAAVLAGEWLFRTLLTPLRGRVDQFGNDQGATQRVLSQPAIYSSLGLAAYTLPAARLVAWSANRLGGELVDVLLRSELFARVAARLLDFDSRAHLRPDDLIEEELRLGRDGKPLQLQPSYIAHLRSVPHQQIVPAVQAALSAIRKDVLPGLKRQIDANAQRVLRVLEEAVHAETASILRESPAGGLSLAAQFAAGLRSRATRCREALARREAAYRGRSQQQVAYLNQLGPALQNAVASIPSYPILVASILAGLLAPLLLVSSWVWRGYGGASSSTAMASLALIWLLALGAAAYAYWRTAGGIDEIRDRYVTLLNDRFQTELSLSLVQRAGELYPEVEALADAELARLNDFASDLHTLVRAFKSRLNTTPLCSDVDFALQRSVLTPEIVEESYVRVLGPGGAEARLAALLEAIGTLDQWRQYEPEELEAAILSYGERVFAPMYDLDVETLLAQQMTSQTQTETLIRGLLDKAAPLWSYDSFSLGQSDTLATQTLVGLELPSASQLRPHFARVSPTIMFEATADPHSLIVTTLRSGLPLFALRRMGELAQCYINAVRSHALPLHIDDEMALVPDLRPRGPKQPTMEAPTAFALGVSLGMISQRDDGVYAVHNARGKEIGALASERVDSAILLGADDKLLATVANRIQAIVSEKGATDAAARLEAYLAKAEYEAWEETCIRHYVELLRG